MTSHSTSSAPGAREAIRTAAGLSAALGLFMCLFAVSARAQGGYDDEGASPLSVWQQSREAQRQFQREHIERLKRRAAAEPDNPAHQLDLGRAYYWLALERDPQAQSEAEQTFRQILARSPDNAVALAYHGALLGLKLDSNAVPQDQFPAVAGRAHEELDRAVGLAPDSVEVRELRGYASFYTPSQFGRDPLAVEDFTRAIELLERSPGNERARAKTHLVLGDTYNKMGEAAGARANWERAIRLAPDSSLAAVAEGRLRGLAEQPDRPVTNFKELTAFFGFLAGVIIFALLSVMALRDLRRARRGGILASLVVSLAALLWNASNFALVTADALGGASPPAGRWHSGLLLALALSPIPAGVFAAYRFYKATLIDVVLKRGAALLVLLALSLLFAQLVEARLLWPLMRVTNPALRSIFVTGLWLALIALYPPLRDYIYGLFDRHLFRRRDHALLLGALNERLHAVTDKASLLEAAADTLRDAFACQEARFVPRQELGERLAGQLGGEDVVPVWLPEGSGRVAAGPAAKGVRLALAVRAGGELSGALVLGGRAYGQDYLSEDLGLLRAAVAQINRALENMSLHEARRRHAIAEGELRKLVAESELKALRAQIDPHFFFNALNSIAALIGRNPAAAEEMVEDLADLFRHSFKPGRDFISLGEELRLVETYLKIERVRLGDKLRYRKAVSPDALAVRVPALTVQPLVENAVKHGVSGSRDGGFITLSAAVENGRLVVAVADTGAGVPASELPQLFSRGVGLANVNGRLVGLYGAGAGLRVDSVFGHGTTVSFTTPLAAQESPAVA